MYNTGRSLKNVPSASPGMVHLQPLCRWGPLINMGISYLERILVGILSLITTGYGCPWVALRSRLHINNINAGPRHSRHKPAKPSAVRFINRSAVRPINVSAVRLTNCNSSAVRHINPSAVRPINPIAVMPINPSAVWPINYAKCFWLLSNLVIHQI